MSLFDQELSIKEIVTTESESDNNYVKFPLYLILADWIVPIDIYLKLIDANGSPAYICACGKNIIFESTWKEKLEKKNILNLYYHKSDEKVFLDYIAGFLARNKKEQPALQYTTYLCDLSVYWLRFFFSNISLDNIYYGPKLVNELLETVNTDSLKFSDVLNVWKTNQNLYVHSVTTLIIGLSFLCFLKFNDLDLKKFGLGILLHDIGMIDIPEHIRNKPEKLTDQEMLFVKKHPKLSFNHLKDFSIIDKKTLTAILQHHENCDGSGYPYNLKQNELEYCSKILRVVDSFTALTNRRPWRGAVPVREIIYQMKLEWEDSKIYDTDVLKQFILFTAHG